MVHRFHFVKHHSIIFCLKLIIFFSFLKGEDLEIDHIFCKFQMTFFYRA
jgi:hypothetical protein